MRRREALRWIGCGMAAAYVSPAEAKVARTSFPSLVSGSDVIAFATVVDVIDDHGIALARAVPKQTYKGKALAELFFVAEATWTCDTSEAVKGETVVLFLEKTKSQLVTIRNPKRPPIEISSMPLFEIAHHGRGRMPVEAIKGIVKVTLYTSDLEVPKSIVPEMEGTVGNLRPRVPFDRMERAIRQELSRQARVSKNRS